MESGWLKRLFEAIEADGRSLREISLKAKCGPNYLQQVTKDGKEPGGDRLARILDVLGRDAAFYVWTGTKLTEEDLEFLRILAGFDPEMKSEAKRFLRLLPGNAGKQ
nr:transcriptional regulator [Cereibacter sphaeroides f. sp. denitrificans]